MYCMCYVHVFVVCPQLGKPTKTYNDTLAIYFLWEGSIFLLLILLLLILLLLL